MSTPSPDELLTSTDSSPPSLAALEHALPWRLTCVDSPDRGAAGTARIIGDPAGRGLSLSLGRTSPEAVGWAFEDAQLSRRHATISGAGGRWTVRDHGSKNGTWLNGVRVEGTTSLEVGAVVRVGATLLLFERDTLSRPVSAPDPELVGRSTAHLDVLDAIRTVAGTGLPVLLLGETGTGKDVTASQIHRHSGCSGAFVAVNCAAIPHNLAESLLFGHKRGAFTGATQSSPGYFAAADGGTLFLDEIGELALDTQAKLLRALESSEYIPLGATAPVRARARIIAATNVDLRAAAAHGTFRMDLYARLAAFPVHLPPLRERRADIPLLLRKFVTQAAPRWRGTIEAPLLEALLLHDWPMNIRELQMVAQRIVLLHPAAEALTVAHLPRDLLWSPDGGADRDEAAEDLSREALAQLLTTAQGNVAEVARRLGRDRTQVYRWLKRYDLQLDDFRAP